MNEKTLNKLEYNKIREKLAELAYFEGGRKMALNMMPAKTFNEVIRRLDETEEAMEAMRYKDPSYLNGIQYIEAHLEKASRRGILNSLEIREIGDVLRAARIAKKYINSFDLPRLGKIGYRLQENAPLETKIEDTIDENGDIKDNATPALKNIRNQINNGKNRIKDYLRNFIRSSNNQKLLQDALVTERDGRYVIPVKQEYRHDIKGIVHDESASGATVFIEPMPVVEHNNKIRKLQQEEKREIERILTELSEHVYAFTEELRINLELLSLIDYIFARARMAYRSNSYRPQISRDGIIDISRGRHPLLGDDAVPMDVQLGREFDILVVTGPNTGGKTVALKTVGLLNLMGMSGLFIPARENSCINVFSSIYVDIGDEQSIEQSLSTFSAHMNNIIDILSRVDSNSLVLIDEMGAGTDPIEGAALATVILEEMLKKQVKVMVTTHQSELKSFAYQNDRVENACVEFDPISLRPTYKLTIGMPGQSNAFEIARRLGLGSNLVERAKKFVPKNELEMSNMIRQMKESQRNYEVSAREVEILKAKLTREKELLSQEKQKFQEEKEAILTEAHHEAARYLRKLKSEADEAVDDLKQLIKTKDKPPKWHEVEKQRQKLKQIKPEVYTEDTIILDQKQEITPGDYVYIKNIKQIGYVLEGPNAQGEVMVQAGMMRLSVKISQLQKTKSPERNNVKVRNNTFLEKARNISKEIDVRGKLAEEALIEIDKYLEDANLVGVDSVRIIHGKGTGALRKAVREYLKNHRYIKSYHDGSHNEGGYGVTIAEFH